MVTRDIKCGVCGHEGKIEAHDTVDSVPESHIFKTLGMDSSGFLRFHCPSCRLNLAVNPKLRLTIAKQIVGYPVRTRQVERLPCMVWGVVCLLLSIFLFAKFDGWWVYVVSGGLLLFGLSLSVFVLSGKTQIKEIGK